MARGRKPREREEGIHPEVRKRSVVGFGDQDVLI